MADPTKKKLLTPEQIERCEFYSGLGLTQVDMAALCNMSRATFQRRIHDQPQLADALLKGEAIAASKVANSLFKQATSGKNTAATIFWLKVRKGWKESDNYDDTNEDYKRPDTLKGSNGKGKPISD
jgi:predicted DNA-binding protein (UPF0251 family)